MGQCSRHKRTNFEKFLLLKSVEVGVVVLKELILNSFYFGGVLVVLKELILTVSFLGQCAGLDRSDFKQFLLWEGVVILKELN